MITYDQHDNDYTILKKILRAIHDHWTAGTMLFSAEPPVGAYLDLKMTLWKKILQAVNLVTGGGGGVGGAVQLYIEPLGGIYFAGHSVDPVTMLVPEINVGPQWDGVTQVFTTAEAGDYLLTLRMSVESVAPGAAITFEVFHNGVAVFETPSPIEVVSGGVGTTLAQITAVRRTLAAGDLVQLRVTSSVDSSRVLQGDNGVGGKYSFFTITRLDIAPV